jgi:hypothetical protein
VLPAPGHLEVGHVGPVHGAEGHLGPPHPRQALRNAAW